MVAHHEALGEGGKGIKAPDSHCVPLCVTCHDRRDHEGRETFWSRVDIKKEIMKYLTEYLRKHEI